MSPDQVIDTDKLSLPFPDESFDEIISEDYFQTILDKLAWMKEMYRIMKHGAFLIVIVPSYKSDFAYHHPEQKSVWIFQTFMRFTKKYYEDIKLNYPYDFSFEIPETGMEEIDWLVKGIHKPMQTSVVLQKL